MVVKLLMVCKQGGEAGEDWERLDGYGRGRLTIAAGSGAVRLLDVTGGDIDVRSSSGDVTVELPVPGYACHNLQTMHD